MEEGRQEMDASVTNAYALTGRHFPLLSFRSMLSDLYWLNWVCKTNTMRFLLILALVSVLYSQPAGLPRPAPNTDTWVPIYTSSVTSRQVSFHAPRPIVTSGKIYTFGSYLLQVEKDSGIHVID